MRCRCSENTTGDQPYPACPRSRGGDEIFARVNGEDEDLWALAGLVHDIDWETTNDDPSKHTTWVLRG